MSDPLDVLIYSIQSGDDIEVLLKDESIWATQLSISKLFGVDKGTVSRHIKNIYSDGELESGPTVAKIETVRSEGDREVKRTLEYYNLDMIISVGYRVNSQKATNFRIWATRILKEYTIKGFVLDDERLKKNSTLFDKDYFDELLERVRSIRASERRIWQKITDIYAECSTDYDKDSKTTKDFYAMVQNKFHYAITGQTAPEIIYNTADHNERNMGLHTWKLAPDGAIRQADIVIAKNYLSEDDIRRLERAVSSYFDYIERLIESKNTFTMEEFSRSVDAFLNFMEYRILTGKGTITRDKAESKAKLEYDIYKQNQRYLSDFDKSFGQLDKNNGDQQ